MLTLHSKTASATAIYGRLVLAYDQREKCRLRAQLDSGEEVAIFTVRGTVLRDGDLLHGAEGLVVQVAAAPEATYVVECASEQALARCAYHLGNRHTQVQIGQRTLRMRADPVLRDMVQGLGARVTEEMAPFEPEAGAYAGGGHGHGQHGGHPGDGHPLAPIPLRQKIHRPGDAA